MQTNYLQHRYLFIFWCFFFLCFTENLFPSIFQPYTSKLTKVCFCSACFDFTSDGTVKLKEPVCVSLCVCAPFVSTALIIIITSAEHHSPQGCCVCAWETSVRGWGLRTTGLWVFSVVVFFFLFGGLCTSTLSIQLFSLPFSSPHGHNQRSSVWCVAKYLIRLHIAQIDPGPVDKFLC